MVVIVFVHSLGFVADSFNIGESSDSPMGLPCRWILKSVIPFSMLLLGISSISSLVQSIATILKINGASGEVHNAS